MSIKYSWLMKRRAICSVFKCDRLACVKRGWMAKSESERERGGGEERKKEKRKGGERFPIHARTFDEIARQRYRAKTFRRSLVRPGMTTHLIIIILPFVTSREKERSSCKDCPVFVLSASTASSYRYLVPATSNSSVPFKVSN